MTDQPQQLTFEEAFLKEEKEIKERIYNYHENRKTQKEEDEYFEKTVKPRERRWDDEHDVRKLAAIGRFDRERFKLIRERVKQRRGMNAVELNGMIDKVVDQERDPQTGLLCPRRGEKIRPWANRLAECNRKITDLWYHNRRTVVTNTPRYIEGFPAKQVLETSPPRIEAHYAQHRHLLEDKHCTECRKIGMSCTLTFTYLTKGKSKPRPLHQAPCQRCERKGIRCHQEWTDEDTKDMEQKNAFALPIWWDDTMRM